MRKPVTFVLCMALVVAGGALILRLTPDALAQPPTQPATRPANWFGMSPDEFAQTEAANRELPWEALDDRLMSAAILHETNRHRVEHKLTALRHMPRVDDAAAMHAADMAEHGFFSHENPHDATKRTVMDRVKRLGLNPMFVGENILIEFGIRYEPRRKVFEVPGHDGSPGVSYEPDGKPIPPHTYLSFAQRIVQRWMDSPPHRENILSPHARYLGSAARPGRSEQDLRFRRFYAAQVFFAPMPRR